MHNKSRFTQYISTNPALKKVLEGKHQPKEANFTHQLTDNLRSAKPKEGKQTTTPPEKEQELTTTGH